MAAATVRINPRTHEQLKHLSEQAGEPMPTILEKAVDAYRRQQFLLEVNRGFARLREDPKAWQDELAERAAW